MLIFSQGFGGGFGVDFDGSGNDLTSDLGLPTSGIGNRYLWQGREYDATTGLYYFRARWYNPETGRWLSKDPIGIAGRFNLYAFCGNNPVNFVDPSGLRGEMDQSLMGDWTDTAAVI